MNCRICYQYHDGTLLEDSEFGIIDPDYLTIRQYRKIFTKLAKEYEQDCFVRLVFTPVVDDCVFTGQNKNKFEIKVIHPKKV